MIKLVAGMSAPQFGDESSCVRGSELVQYALPRLKTTAVQHIYSVSKTSLSVRHTYLAKVRADSSNIVNTAQQATSLAYDDACAYTVERRLMRECNT
jgi:hypothetical protein